MPPGPVELRCDGVIKSRGDSVDPALQRLSDRSSIANTEHSRNCANNTNGDDDVLERHHAVLIGAQTLERFRGLNIVLQHRRKSFFYTMNLQSPLAIKSRCQRVDFIFPRLSSVTC